MSAVIWLGIVAVWGFVLIPMWLRHHDGVAEQRSADRFTTAMRVLSRRGTGDATARTSEGRDGMPYGTPSWPDHDLPTRAELAAGRARRGRVFLGVVAAMLVTALLAATAGGGWVVMQLLSDAALVGCVVWLRRAAMLEQEVRAARRERARRRRRAGTIVPAAAPNDLTGREAPADEHVPTTELPPVPVSYTPVPAVDLGEDTQPFSLVDVPAAPPAADPVPVAEPAATAHPQSRPAARGTPRPGAKPSTSRPGRVQVNPPGATPPVPAAPARPELVPQEPDELEELLDRHVVNG